MTVAVWRIAQAARSFVANDLTGTGAKLTGGSWNNSGVPLVYASSNIAVAAQKRSATSTGRRSVPRRPTTDFLRASIFPTTNGRRARNSLPGDWDAGPAGMTSALVGANWVREATSALLIVPCGIFVRAQSPHQSLASGRASASVQPSANGCTIPVFLGAGQHRPAPMPKRLLRAVPALWKWANGGAARVLLDVAGKLTLETSEPL